MVIEYDPQESAASIANRIAPTCPLDHGIARAVAILQTVKTVRTYESCEGGEGHSYDLPTVRFYGSPGAGWAAYAACDDYGLPVREVARVWDVDHGEPSGPYWQIVFRRRLP